MDYAESVAHLSTTLRHLHKELLDADAKGFGAISGPFQRLSLVAYHPYFARLRGLSELLVDLGRTVTDPNLTLARRLVVPLCVAQRRPTPRSHTSRESATSWHGLRDEVPCRHVVATSIIDAHRGSRSR